MKSERIGTCSNLGIGAPDYTRQVGLIPKARAVILTEAIIAALATSPVADSIALDLTRKYSGAVLEVVATYNALAVLGVRIHVFSSSNGIDWDTADYDTWDAPCVAGATVRRSRPYDTLPAYLRVQVENRDVAQPVTAVSVIATSGA